MSERDLARVARIIRAAEAGTLSDLSLVAAFAAVRAEAIAAERDREVKRLQRLARGHLAAGNRQLAEVLADAADGLDLKVTPELPS